MALVGVSSKIISGFDPRSVIPGCVLWLDAADANTITLSGSNVTGWNDKSGNNNHFVQSTSSAQPTYISNSLSFNGTSNYLYQSNTSQYILNNLSAWTIFSVQKINTAAGGTQIVYRYGIRGILYESISTTYYFFNYSPIAVSGSGDGIAAVVVANATETGYINGVSQGSATGPTTTGQDAFTLGASNASSGFLNGYIYEIIMFNTALTTTQRQQVEGYLAWKWGLQGSLPSSHPSYYAPPASQVVFTPAQLSGLILWLDAADNSTITLSSSTVTQWRDKSIYNGLMTSGSPTYSSTRLNSLPAITTTTATPTYMTGSFGNGLASTQYYTLFFVFNYTAYSGGSSRLFGMAAAGNTDYQYSGFNCSLANTGSPIAFTFQNCSGSISPNSFTSSTGPTIVTVTVSGNTIIPSAFGIGTPSFGQAGNSLGADWSEVLIFNTTLTTAQQNQVEGYLAWKWGLQGSLPSSHPYYKISP